MHQQHQQDHGQIWKKIADVYQQWDQDRNNAMAMDELSERLPDLPPELIEHTLATARAEGRVSEHGDGRFRLIPNH